MSKRTALRIETIPCPLCSGAGELSRIDAAKTIQSVSGLVVRYRERLRYLCDNAGSTEIALKSQPGGNCETVGS